MDKFGVNVKSRFGIYPSVFNVGLEHWAIIDRIQAIKLVAFSYIKSI